MVLLGEGQPDLICGEDHAEEDHGHGPCDPHLWLDPAYAVRYAERILGGPRRLGPRGPGPLPGQPGALQKEVEALDRAYRACGLKGTKVVVQHDAFRYFARRYGLEVVGVLSQGGAQEVGSRSFLALLEKAKREGVRLVLAEPQFQGKALKTLAEAIGARVAVLYTDTLDARVRTYLDLLRHNLRALCP